MKGVAVSQTTTFDGISGTSFAGGGELTIAGYGFDGTPSANQIMLATSDVSSTTLNLMGTPLTGKYPLDFPLVPNQRWCVFNRG